MFVLYWTLLMLVGTTGKVDELRRQHEQDMQELHRTSSVRKERMNQGLKEKLQERRNRRNKNGEE